MSRDDKPVRPGRALWKRYLIGTLLIVLAAATATSVAALNEVEDVVNAFQEGTGLDLSGELAEADVGKPQTIMLIGSDQRAKGARDFESGARSDTLILVRLDPAKKRTALLSPPRDLKVQTPRAHRCHTPARGTERRTAPSPPGAPNPPKKPAKHPPGPPATPVTNGD